MARTSRQQPVYSPSQDQMRENGGHVCTCGGSCSHRQAHRGWEHGSHPSTQSAPAWPEQTQHAIAFRNATWINVGGLFFKVLHCLSVWKLLCGISRLNSKINPKSPIRIIYPATKGA